MLGPDVVLRLILGIRANAKARAMDRNSPRLGLGLRLGLAWLSMGMLSGSTGKSWGQSHGCIGARGKVGLELGLGLSVGLG